MLLPKSEAELESLRTGFQGLKRTKGWTGGLPIDATDFDEDGMWKDSYGNVVTFFAPLHHYPDGQDYPDMVNYEYMGVRGEDEDLVSLLVPNKWVSGAETIGFVFCQLPLDPPTPPVYEPPTPVEGKTIKYSNI